MKLSWQNYLVSEADMPTCITYPRRTLSKTKPLTSMLHFESRSDSTIIEELAEQSLLSILPVLFSTPLIRTHEVTDLYAIFRLAPMHSLSSMV